jgi:hypothetical protein
MEREQDKDAGTKPTNVETFCTKSPGTLRTTNRMTRMENPACAIDRPSFKEKRAAVQDLPPRQIIECQAMNAAKKFNEFQIAKVTIVGAAVVLPPRNYPTGTGVQLPSQRSIGNLRLNNPGGTVRSMVVPGIFLCSMRHYLAEYR